MKGTAESAKENWDWIFCLVIVLHHLIFIYSNVIMMT